MPRLLFLEFDEELRLLVAEDLLLEELLDILARDEDPLLFTLLLIRVLNFEPEAFTLFLLFKLILEVLFIPLFDGPNKLRTLNGLILVDLLLVFLCTSTLRIGILYFDRSIPEEPELYVLTLLRFDPEPRDRELPLLPFEERVFPTEDPEPLLLVLPVPRDLPTEEPLD